MRFLYVIIFIFPAFLFSQSKLKILPAGIGSVPGGVQYKGAMKEAIRWKDDTGENYAIVCESGVYKGEKQDVGMETTYAEVYAFRYLMKGNKPETQWKIQDFVKDCPFDVTCNFINKTLQATDLDDNGIAEIWVMYQLVCRSDVSPCNLKLIMYEGTTKHAMRGKTKVPMGENFIGGEYKFDEAFEAAPQTFRDFALKLWNDHVKEDWK